MKPTASALIVVCGLLLLSLPAALGAAGPGTTEDVPVRGGIAALADAIPISPAPDRARFIAEAIRVVYSWPQGGPYSNEPTRRRIAAFLASGASTDTHDDIPVPLPAAVWSQAVFHRAVSRDDLVGAILADRSSALVCYSLAAMDDETLQFFADHTALLSRMAERAPAQFAAFGESVRIRNGRLVVPGGDGAAAAWESVVGEKLERSDRFLEQLFEADRGRLAYLFDVLAHLDASTLTLAIDAGGNSADALKRLAALARRGFPEWDVTTAPFVRPPTEFGAFFARLRSNADAEGGVPGFETSAFWQKVFDESGGSANGHADAVWLAETILGHPARERERRLELFSFTQRVFASAAGDETIAAAHSFGAFPVLALTLERMGIRAPSIYIAAAQHAEKLTALDSARGSIALSQFQGSLALLARIVSVRTLETPAAEALARELFALRLDDSGYYGGAIAVWITDRLRAALPPPPPNSTIDDVILGAAAGPRATSAATVEWEGQRYRVDPGGAEIQRLRRTRERQEGVTFATAIGVTALVRRLNTSTATLDGVRDAAAVLEAAAAEIAVAERPADESAVRALRDASRTLGAIRRPSDLSDARRAVAPLAPVADAMLGNALLSLAYASDLGDPDGTILIAGDPSRRHDFGFDLAGREARLKAMWGVAAIETRRGPWHLVGSALALDIAMAPLALRRISVDRVPTSPMLNLMQRDGFAATVAVMNDRGLSDADRDRIADRIDKGRQRLDGLTSGRETTDALARDIDLDGWRLRALTWTVAHDPEHVPTLFSLTELLVLGGGTPSAFNAWGTYAFRTTGCLCPRLAPPGEWRRWWGLSQAGLPATLVADLPLNVAVVLHNLHLPAVLAKPVLAAAMQDFVDGINPTDGNDWLSLARAAQAIDRNQFEDYVAAATADGPLVAESADGDNR